MLAVCLGPVKCSLQEADTVDALGSKYRWVAAVYFQPVHWEFRSEAIGCSGAMLRVCSIWSVNLYLCGLCAWVFLSVKLVCLVTPGCST